MSVRDEVVKLLHSRGRVEEDVKHTESVALHLVSGAGLSFTT
jgi:hypothetical protein